MRVSGRGHGTKPEGRTVLDLGHLATDLAQDFTAPAFAFTQAFTPAGHLGASVCAGTEAQLCRLGLTETVEHGLGFFFITRLSKSHESVFGLVWGISDVPWL